MTRKLAVCIFFACATTLCAPLLARADEPCKAVGKTVVCDRAAFDVLVSKLLDAQKARDACTLRTEASTAETAALTARVDAANAERDRAAAEAAAIKAQPKPYGRRAAAIGLGVLSGLGLVAAPNIKSSTVSNSVLGLSLGSAAAASALILSE